MAFAKGRHSKAISDRSGLEFPYQEMVKEWNGSLVHISEFEPKQPQLEPKPQGADPQGLLNPRSARTELPTSTILTVDAFSTTNGSTTITVFEPDHGRSTGDIIRFTNAPSVGGINANAFNLETTINGAITATSNSITLTDGSDFPTSGYVFLEKVDLDPVVARRQDSTFRMLPEVIKYTARVGNVLSGLTRGTSAPFFGVSPAVTSARSYDSGTKIFGGRAITIISQNRTNFANATESFSNKYTFTVSGTATSTTSGGGSNVFVGPVSQRA